MTITRTIGSGGDHADINEWVAYLQANALDGGGDLIDDVVGNVLNGEIVVSAVQEISGLQTTHPSARSITLQAAPGASFADNAGVRNNPLIYDGTKGAAIRTANGTRPLLSLLSCDNVTVKGLQLYADDGFGIGVASSATAALVVDGCIVQSRGNEGACFLTTGNSSGITLQNSAFIATLDTTQGVAMYSAFVESSVLDCTIVNTAGGAASWAGLRTTAGDVTVKGTVVAGFAVDLTTFADGTFSGSNNATDKSSWGGGIVGGDTSAQLDLVMATEFVDAALDFRIQSASVKLIGNGIASGTPTTDISGQSRNTPPAIGAWENSPVSVTDDPPIAVTQPVRYAPTLAGQALAARALIQRVGQSVTVRRASGSQGIVFSVDCTASIRGYRPEELIPAVVIQGDREVTLDPTRMDARKWPQPPRRGDQIVISGTTTTVQSVEARQVGEDLAFYVIHVTG